MRRRRALTAALAVTLVMAGCSTDLDRTDEEVAAVSPETSLPADNVTILTEETPAELALAVSRALYDRAPVVMLASAADTDGQQEAAATVAETGVPMLVLSPGGDAAGADVAAALRDELTRLDTEIVLAVGDAAAGWASDLELALDVVPTDPSDGVAGALAAAVPRPGVTPATDMPPAAATPVTVTPADPLAALAVLTPDAPHTVVAAATARAAGARVLVTDVTDPRMDPAVIEALSARPPTHTIALGADFGPAETLRGRMAVVSTGVQLPGGGQVVYPGRVMVALYGHPDTPVLGALGEQPMEEAIARAKEVAAAYEPLVDEPVVPTLEIITTIAAASAGPQGDYSTRTPVATLEPWVDAAREAGVYVVLDLQPGHTDFLSQAKEYEELLVQPHVGLALDPEWRLAPDQRHMVHIGSVDAEEVNEVVEWLADLTAAHALPQKLLVLHQFTLRMITNRDAVDTDRDEVAVLIHADGFGTHAQKFHTWNALLRNAPDGVWWGWKNFYDEDRPTMTPEETVAVDPLPRFVSYQ
jgi:hypothetical protein